MIFKILIICLCLMDVLGDSRSLRDEAYATTDELIRMYGYPAETHTVTTQDGYILVIHRIPSSPKCPGNTTRSVIVQHGNTCSSANWVYMGPDKSLGFYLADRCFDVWLPNSRGNTYSKKHQNLNVNSREYWDFDWHEMGIYDTPAVIDYILDKTGEESLYYIGHSQGTTQLVVLATERPEYSDKFKLAMLLGPGVYMDHTTSPPMVLGAAGAALAQVEYDAYGAKEMMAHTSFITEYGLIYCTDLTPLTQITCAESQFYIAGTDVQQLNYTRLPVIYGHDPAGASSKQALHYYQIMNSGMFRQFDYGSSKNLQVYGDTEPPMYNLKKITIPISIHYGLNDLITTPTDAKHLAQELPVLAGLFEVPYSKFNHLDFMYAIDANDLVYKDLVEIMNRQQ